MSMKGRYPLTFVTASESYIGHYFYAQELIKQGSENLFVRSLKDGTHL